MCGPILIYYESGMQVLVTREAKSLESSDWKGQNFLTSEIVKLSRFRPSGPWQLKEVVGV